jgi:isocitrate lyase
MSKGNGHGQLTGRDRETAMLLEKDWASDPRWEGITRPYSAADVVRLRGSVLVEHTLARLGSERLWRLMQTEPFIRTLGAMTGNQAVQMVQAGLKAIYVSGWQVAGDMNGAGQTYPDQSLYPADSVPKLIRRINNALARADQITHAENRSEKMPYWYAPIVADGEAGFGGVLNAFELTKAMIEAGVAGVHYEDQLSSAKKCGHMGGKVLVPTREAVQKLVAARLAADVMAVPTVVIARTDANGAKLITSDIDERDRPFITGSERTPEGFYHVRSGIESAIARGLAYAPFADLVWCETAKPDLEEARRFAEAIHAKFPGKPLAYNCSPSFNWRLHLDEETIARFQVELGAMGYKFQFVTLAGFHSLNTIMFDLAHGYRDTGMSAYSSLQEREFELQKEHGYRAVKHQSFVGAGYFDEVTQAITSGESSVTALTGSTEEEQFQHKTPDFTEAEIHHVGGAELKKVSPSPRIVQ